MNEREQLKHYREEYEAMEKNMGDWVDYSIESAKFTSGHFGKGQWTTEQIDELEKDDRAPLQLQLILPKVNLITGLERQQRSGWEATAFGVEDEVWPQLMTPLMMHLDRNKYLQNLFSGGFKNTAMTGLDWIDQYIMDDWDYGKRLVIERESWKNVKIDHEARTDDIDKWERLARHKWLPFDRAKIMYPDTIGQFKNIERFAEAGGDIATDIKGENSKDFGEFYHDHDKETTDYNVRNYINLQKQAINLIDMWERHWETQFRIAYNDPEQGRMKLTDQFKTQGEANEFRDTFVETEGIEDRDRVVVIKRRLHHIEHGVFSGNVMAGKPKKDEYNHKQFPLTPIIYYAIDNGEGLDIFGLVENLKDPQREKNKRRSVATDMIGRTPKGGGLFNNRGGLTAEKIQKASESGTWEGIPLKRGEKVSDHMQQWSQTHLQILNYLVNYEQLSADEAKEISGANDPMLGIAAGAKESGFAANTRIRQGMLTLEEVFENLDRAKRRVLSQAVQNMQQFYSSDKIIRIIGESIKIGPQPSEKQVTPDEIKQFVEAFKSEETLMKYDIILTKTQSPTMKAMKAQEVKELISQAPGYAGALLPLFVENSDYESKDQVLEAIKSVQTQEGLIKVAQAMSKNKK